MPATRWSGQDRRQREVLTQTRVGQSGENPNHTRRLQFDSGRSIRRVASDDLWREAARKIDESPERYPEYAQLKEALALATKLVDSGDVDSGARVLGELATKQAAAQGVDLSLTFGYWVRHLNVLKRPKDAELVLRAALATTVARQGRHHRGSLALEASLRSNLLGRKRWAEAATLQEQIVADTEVAYGEPATSRELRHLEEMSSRVHGLDASTTAKRRALAVSVLRRSLATCLRTWPSEHPEVGRAHLH